MSMTLLAQAERQLLQPGGFSSRDLDRVFAQLKPGGIAYFQLPTYEQGYRFSAASYLKARGDKLDMEMHVLPQKDVLRIAARHGLQTMEVLEHAIPELRMGHMSNYFLLRRPNER